MVNFVFLRNSQNVIKYKNIRERDDGSCSCGPWWSLIYIINGVEPSQRQLLKVLHDVAAAAATDGKRSASGVEDLRHRLQSI